MWSASALRVGVWMEFPLRVQKIWQACQETLIQSQLSEAVVEMWVWNGPMHGRSHLHAGSSLCFAEIEQIYYRRRVSQAAKRKANERSKGKVTEGGFRVQSRCVAWLLAAPPHLDVIRTRVFFETSFDSKQPKLEPKLVSALSKTKRLFRLFRFCTETESFDVSIEPKQTEDPPKPLKREYTRWKYEVYMKYEYRDENLLLGSDPAVLSSPSFKCILQQHSTLKGTVAWDGFLA